jgi:hypothetical protein
MARTPTAVLTDPNNPAAELLSALETYQQLSDAHVIRGIRLIAAGFDGSVLIVVGASEYYAVAPADIVFEEVGDPRFPRLIWVKKDATVWRCQQTALEGPGAKGVTSQELSSLHADLSARIHDLSSRSDLLAGTVRPEAAPVVLARAAAPEAAPAVQLAGSVLSGHPMPAPSDIKHYVLQAAAFPTQSPWADSTDDSVPISSLRQGIDPIEDLAKICMITKPFSDDGLQIDYASVEAMGTTLGGFVNYIEYCYRHPR